MDLNKFKSINLNSINNPRGLEVRDNTGKKGKIVSLAKHNLWDTITIEFEDKKIASISFTDDSKEDELDKKGTQVKVNGEWYYISSKIKKLPKGTEGHCLHCGTKNPKNIQNSQSKGKKKKKK